LKWQLRSKIAFHFKIQQEEQNGCESDECKFFRFGLGQQQTSFLFDLVNSYFWGSVENVIDNRLYHTAFMTIAFVSLLKCFSLWKSYSRYLKNQVLWLSLSLEQNIKYLFQTMTVSKNIFDSDCSSCLGIRMWYL